MRIISFDIEDKMKSIGWYQIVGGVYGMCLVINYLIHEGTLTGFDLFLFVIAFLLFGFSIYCGNLLRKTDMKGLTLSQWNQALQVMQISVWPIAYYYYSGIRAAVGFNWDETFSPDASLSLSGLALHYNTVDASHLSIWINLVPVAIIYWIGKIENDIEERKQLMESAKKVSEEYSSEIKVSSQE